MKNLIFPLLLLMLFSACSDSNDDNRIDRLIDELKDATASFHEIDNAIAAGWTDDITGCMDHPDHGGMGHHYANFDYFDGRTTHTQPQALIYEPLANGQLGFVGVEFIIPFTVLADDAEPPVLFDQQYSRNYVFNVWALHVWMVKNNPNGMFADWNPDVSCQFAAD
jgi:hypothetical protein